MALVIAKNRPIPAREVSHFFIRPNFICEEMSHALGSPIIRSLFCVDIFIYTVSNDVFFY